MYPQISVDIEIPARVRGQAQVPYLSNEAETDIILLVVFQLSLNLF